MNAAAFVRYANARIDQADREETYRIYVTEYLGGKAFKVPYRELVHGGRQEDFDAEQVVDDVITRMELE